MILWLLEEQDRALSEIAALLGLTQPSASHHIRILELHNLVQSRKVGGRIIYQLVDREALLNCRIFANKPPVMLTEANLISPDPS